MARRYLAFDIETAKDVSDEEFDMQKHRSLGIACAAALPYDTQKPIVWHGEKADGTPSQQMSISETQQVVRKLVELSSQGYTLLTWNGLGFDFDILAEESGSYEKCRNLALHHVDMMFHVFCDRGFPVAIDRAAKAMGIQGKPTGMSGMMAPRLWPQGSYQDVIDYVCQDVRMTLQVAEACEKKRSFQWITRRGSRSSMNLHSGWLTVKDALRLPSPDTSWMDDPIPRYRFTKWLDET